jgi:hypothetical protein
MPILRSHAPAWERTSDVFRPFTADSASVWDSLGSTLEQAPVQVAGGASPAGQAVYLAAG